MSMQQELDAADMHLYRYGGMDAEPIESHSIVRIFTGPDREQFIEVRAHSSGWVEITSWGGLIVKPVASNSLMVKPERAS